MLNRQTDLQKLCINTSQNFSSAFIKRLALELPSVAATQTQVSLSTTGEVCGIPDLIETGILEKAFDTFLACDHLADGGIDGFLLKTILNQAQSGGL
jgi:hypothetical protein